MLVHEVGVRTRIVSERGDVDHQETGLTCGNDRDHWGPRASGEVQPLDTHRLIPHPTYPKRSTVRTEAKDRLQWSNPGNASRGRTVERVEREAAVGGQPDELSSVRSQNPVGHAFRSH